MNKKYFDMVHNTLLNFDFDKVEKVMQVLNWHWCTASEGIPSADEIKDVAKNLLINTIERYEKSMRHKYTATGGFQVSFDGNILEINFIVANWDERLDWDEKSD